MKSLLIIVACVLVGIASAANNCPGAAGTAGVNCTDASLCCGYGSMSPSCLPADGSKKCCTHYISSKQCNPDEVCGGGGGPGASSYTTCGPAGSTYCDKGDGQGAFCTSALPTCCGYYGGYGFCCAAGCACNNSYYSCDCPAPTTPAPTTPPAPRNNCPGAAGTAGVNCSSASLCCGSGTMTPSCLPADGSKKCCTHYISSKQCNPDEVCGGSGGPGASSYTQCGAPGTTFCDKGDGQGAFCTSAQPTCCGNYGGYGFCCATGCSCNNTAYTCNCPVPTTPAPTTRPAPRNNCPGAAGTAGVNCSSASLCCGSGTMSPSCLPADGSKKCCINYLASTQCKPNEVCGGGGGPGASSYASCGAPGSTYCNFGTGQGAFCNATQPTCCGSNGVLGFCCAAGCTCNNQAYTCNCPTPAPTTPAPPKNNCPGAAGTAGVNCSSASLCCGAGSMTPSCLPADGSKKCCVKYLASTQCKTNEVCGGGGGPGASSYASCGAPGTTYCDQGTGQGAFCNATQPTCCGNYGVLGFCCASGCTCNNSAYTCSCPIPSTKAPTVRPTTKPTVKPTTRKPTTKAPTKKPTVKPTTKAPTRKPAL